MKTARLSFLKFLYAVVIGIVVSAFSFGVSTVNAQEAQGNVVAAQEDASSGESADNGGGAVLILLGGMTQIVGKSS